MLSCVVGCVSEGILFHWCGRRRSLWAAYFGSRDVGQVPECLDTYGDTGYTLIMEKELNCVELVRIGGDFGRRKHSFSLPRLVTTG